MTTETALVPAVRAGKIAVTQKGASLATVGRAMVAAETNERQNALIPFTASAPVVPTLSEEQEKALGLLPSLIVGLEGALPTTVRTLKDDELSSLIIARRAIDAAIAATDDAKEAIREATFNHFDKVAVKAGLVNDDTPVDAKGHYVIEDKENGRVAGQDKKFTRETRAGSVSFGTPATLADSLEALVESGDLPKDVYLKITKQVRVVDEHAAFEAMKANTDLMPVIRKALTVKADTAALYLRKA